MLDITVKITADGATVYGATIEVEKKEDAEKLEKEVREAIAEILIQHYQGKEDYSDPII